MVCWSLSMDVQGAGVLLEHPSTARSTSPTSTSVTIFKAIMIWPPRKPASSSNLASEG